MWTTALRIVFGGVMAVGLAAHNREATQPGSAPFQLTEVTAAAPISANFSRGKALARKFGTYEIVLTGDGTVSNPFNTVATVTFTPPSGAASAVTAYAFYDGENTWCARAYINEVGTWHWASTSPDDPALNGKTGSFIAVDSNLRGMLRKHSRNPRQWMTDNGQTFINLSDTAYRLLHGEQTRWQQYVQDNVTLGITSMRVGLLPGAWDGYWEDGNRTRYRLENFQIIDVRLQWLLNNYPNMYIQLLFFPDPTVYGTDDSFWNDLPQSVRHNIMRYLIARLASYPQLFFEVTGDMRCSSSYPHNQAMAREVGNYFKANDPWKHLISCGPTRREIFCFTTPQDSWVSYIALQSAYELSADAMSIYTNLPLHIFNEEDYYEQDSRPGLSPINPRYFYRRLFWAWLLSGGSPNYGGRCCIIHPYTQTGSLTWTTEERTISGQLVGLDSIRYIIPYFTERNIDLALFQPADDIVNDLDGDAPLWNYLTYWSLRILKDPFAIRQIRSIASGFKTYLTERFFRANGRAFGSARPKAMRRGDIEYLIYHPNAKSGEFMGGSLGSIEATRRRDTALDTAKYARLRVDLTASPGTFRVEWFRVHDGVAQDGGIVEGEAYRDFVAPWKGYDVILRLVPAEDA